MNKFIEVAENTYNYRITINISQISHYKECIKTAFITLTNGKEINVIESYDEVANMIRLALESDENKTISFEHISG